MYIPTPSIHMKTQVGWHGSRIPALGRWRQLAQPKQEALALRGTPSHDKVESDCGGSRDIDLWPPCVCTHTKSKPFQTTSPLVNYTRITTVLLRINMRIDTPRIFLRMTINLHVSDGLNAPETVTCRTDFFWKTRLLST